jgi:hypothetical protein
MIALYCTPSHIEKPYFCFNIKGYGWTWVIMPEYLNRLGDINYKCIRKVVREKYKTPHEMNYGVSIFK